MKTRKIVAVPSVMMVMLLAACAQPQTRQDRGPATPSSGESVPIAPTAAEAAPSPAAASAPASPEAPIVSDVHIQFTGIQVCDDYLASYKACHYVIGTYATNQIDERLTMLKNAWLERARDPEQREALEVQCNSVAESMKEALNGRKCESPMSDFVEADE